MSILHEISAERGRQLVNEGFTAAGDDEYMRGELALAASAYCLSAAEVYTPWRGGPPGWWPWRHVWWKPSTSRRDLIKAAALIVAEIERIDRAEMRKRK